MNGKRGFLYGLGVAAFSALTACAGQDIKDNDYRKSIEPRIKIERPETQNRNKISIMEPSYFASGMTEQEFTDALRAYLGSRNDRARLFSRYVMQTGMTEDGAALPEQPVQPEEPKDELESLEDILEEEKQLEESEDTLDELLGPSEEQSANDSRIDETSSLEQQPPELSSEEQKPESVQGAVDKEGAISPNTTHEDFVEENKPNVEHSVMVDMLSQSYFQALDADSVSKYETPGLYITGGVDWLFGRVGINTNLRNSKLARQIGTSLGISLTVYGVDDFSRRNNLIHEDEHLWDIGEWFYQRKRTGKPIPPIPDPMTTVGSSGSSGTGGGAIVPDDDPTNYTPEPLPSPLDPMTTVGGGGSTGGSSGSGSSGGASGTPSD